MEERRAPSSSARRSTASAISVTGTPASLLTSATSEADPAQVSDIAAGGGRSARRIGERTLRGRVLVAGHPWQVAEHEERGHKTTVSSRPASDIGEKAYRAPYVPTTATEC